VPRPPFDSDYAAHQRGPFEAKRKALLDYVWTTAFSESDKLCIRFAEPGRIPQLRVAS